MQTGSSPNKARVSVAGGLATVLIIGMTYAMSRSSSSSPVDVPSNPAQSSRTEHSQPGSIEHAPRSLEGIVAHGLRVCWTSARTTRRTTNGPCRWENPSQEAAP